jgi:hypothetical protein
MGAHPAAAATRDGEEELRAPSAPVSSKTATIAETIFIS